MERKLSNNIRKKTVEVIKKKVEETANSLTFHLKIRKLEPAQA